MENTPKKPCEECQKLRMQLLDAQLLNVKYVGQIETLTNIVDKFAPTPKRPAVTFSDGSVMGLDGQIIKPALKDS